jgi:hypothetical protein
MAIIAMNGAKLEEPDGWQNGFWRENPRKRKKGRIAAYDGGASYTIFVELDS